MPSVRSEESDRRHEESSEGLSYLQKVITRSCLEKPLVTKQNQGPIYGDRPCVYCARNQHLRLSPTLCSLTEEKKVLIQDSYFSGRLLNIREQEFKVWPLNYKGCLLVICFLLLVYQSRIKKFYSFPFPLFNIEMKLFNFENLYFKYKKTVLCHCYMHS